MQKIIVITLSFLITLSGCTRFDRPQVHSSRKVMGIIDKNQLMPRAYRKQTFDFGPGGNSSYDLGFQDGCQTATSAIGTGLYRLRGPKVEANKLTEDPWYLRGFQDASTYCTLTLDWETH